MQQQKKNNKKKRRGKDNNAKQFELKKKKNKLETKKKLKQKAKYPLIDTWHDDAVLLFGDKPTDNIHRHTHSNTHT